MTVLFELQAGGSARLLTVNGEYVSLSASRSFPPGATLEVRHREDPEPILIKVRSCRRESDGEHYRVEGRFVNLSRARRERLLAG